MDVTSATAPPRAASGIEGLDSITQGGLPAGRATLMCGPPGCGKTLLAMSFVVLGAAQHGEPGVFFSFEEGRSDLLANAAAVGLPVHAEIEAGRLLVETAGLDPGQVEGNADFTLDGLVLRLEDAIRRIGARRVVVDTIDVVFAALSDVRGVRRELHRLCRRMRDRGVTLLLTGGRGSDAVTSNGVEDYVVDCVIALDHRVQAQLSTRRLRILKYRGCAHGTNEYPFLIDGRGIRVMPITSAALEHGAPLERVPSGIPQLDEMLSGSGYYQGSTVLISGTAGSGKTSVTAHFVDAACRRGERALVLLFEESPLQWLRNMASIGLHLEPWVTQGLLLFHAARPSLHGLELHLAASMLAIEQHEPTCVVVDPISSFSTVGSVLEVKGMLVRLVDFLKLRASTVLMTSLTHDGRTIEHTEQEISSIVDTWIVLRDLEGNGERNRCLHVLKSRGMAHSNQVREFRLTDQGVRLVEVYVGDGVVLTGAARAAQEARERAARDGREAELNRRQQQLARRREALENRIAAMREEFAAEAAEALGSIEADQALAEQSAQERRDMAALRQGRP